MKKVLLALACILFMISCSSDIESTTYHENGAENIVLRDKVAISILKEYSKNLSLNQTKSIGTNNIKIINTKHSCYKLRTIVDKSLPLATKASDLELPDSVQVNLCTVEFMKDNKLGFAIISIDEGIEKVYAYTDNGILSDTCDIPALSETLGNIKFICRDDIVRAKVEKNLNNQNSVRMTPDIKFPNMHSWGNVYPYNKYFPKSDCTWNEQYQGYQSSHWTAVSIATCLDWLDHNKSQSSSDGFAKKFLEVSDGAGKHHRLCYPMPIGTSDSFQISSLEVYLQNKYPNKWEMERKQKSLNVEKVINTLRNGMPVVISTTSASRGVVSWIFDGGHFMLGTNQGNQISDLYCLWGKDGKCDGWYVNYYQPSDTNISYAQNGKGFKQFLYFK